MQASLTTAESLSDLSTIVQQVFETMADMYLIEAADNVVFEQQPVTASLSFSQPSSSQILIECSREFAFTFTERLMAAARPTALDDDVEDAMRELANMIGGNLKGLMPEETRVSIPYLVDEPERQRLLNSGRIVSSMSFVASPADNRQFCRISLVDQARAWR